MTAVVQVRHDIGRPTALALLQVQLATIPGSRVRVIRAPGTDGPSVTSSGLPVAPGDLLLSLASGDALKGSAASTSALVRATDADATADPPGGESWPPGLIRALTTKLESVLWTQKWIDSQLRAGTLTPIETGDADALRFDTGATPIEKIANKASRFGTALLKGSAVGVLIYATFKLIRHWR